MRGAGEADRGVGDGQPPVGLTGDRWAESERVRQGQLAAGEAGHHVAGAAPAVGRLRGVADHDQLCVLALGEEHLLNDRVGVLSLVEQQELTLDPRPP